MSSRVRLEKMIGLLWGSYRRSDGPTFLLVFSPSRSGYVDIEFGLCGRFFYVVRSKKVIS